MCTPKCVFLTEIAIKPLQINHLVNNYYCRFEVGKKN